MRKHHFNPKEAKHAVLLPNQKKEKLKVQAKQVMHNLLFPHSSVSDRLAMMKAQDEAKAKMRKDAEADLQKQKKLKKLKKEQKKAEKKAKIRAAQQLAEKKEMQAVMHAAKKTTALSKPTVSPKLAKPVAKKAVSVAKKVITNKAPTKPLLKKVLKKASAKAALKAAPAQKQAKVKATSKTFKDHSHYGESMRRFLKREAKASHSKVAHARWRHVLDHEVVEQNVKPIVEHIAPAAQASLAGTTASTHTVSPSAHLTNKLKHDAKKQKKLRRKLKLVKMLMKRMKHNKVKLNKIKRNDTPHAHVQERAAPVEYDPLVANILHSHSRHQRSGKLAKHMAQDVLHNMQGFSQAHKDRVAKETAKAHLSSISRLWNAGKLNVDDEFV